MINKLKNLASKLSFEYLKLSFRYFKNLNYKYYIGIVVVAIAIVFGLIFILRAPKPAEAEWFNDAWYYRQSIPVTNNTSSESNVYISVTVDTSDTDKFQVDCGDLRFTKKSGTLLNYYIVSGCGTASTVVHVDFDILPADLQTVYMYYGNVSADNGFSTSDFSTEASDYTIGSLGSEEKGPGPVGYWSFNEGYGTTAHDETFNSNDGTITGATWQTEDQCIAGKCLYFNGSSDFISFNEVFSNENIRSNGITYSA
jgi:hypothetical protein